MWKTLFPYICIKLLKLAAGSLLEDALTYHLQDLIVAGPHWSSCKVANPSWSTLQLGLPDWAGNPTQSGNPVLVSRTIDRLHCINITQHTTITQQHHTTTTTEVHDNQEAKDIVSCHWRGQLEDGLVSTHQESKS